MADFQDLTTEKLDRMAREIVGAKRRGPVKVDPKDQQEVRNDILAGRDRDHHDKWRRVMEHHNFVFLTPPELDAHPLVGPLKVIANVGTVERLSELSIDGSGTVYRLESHKEGQWRRFGRYAESFTVSDLITLFGDDPERFDTWIRDHTLKRHAKAQGLVLPLERPNRATRRRAGRPQRSTGGIVIARR